MISKEVYLKDPCGTLSIPYWKAKNTAVPDGITILHHREFDPALLRDHRDTPYFRLLHPLTEAKPVPAPGFTVRTARCPEDTSLIACIIDRCYPDISVTRQQLEGYTRSGVYCGELWVIACHALTRCPVGCGIAEVDRDLGEGCLEWIQVLPQYRRLGVGRLIVSELLSRMAGTARFATVSGRADGPGGEQLYRSCGFTGRDIWHVLQKK